MPRLVHVAAVATVMALVGCSGSDDGADPGSLCREDMRTEIFSARLMSEVPSDPFDISDQVRTFIVLVADSDYSPAAIASTLASVIVFPADGRPDDQAGDRFGFEREGQFREVDLPAGEYRAYSGRSPEILVVSCP